MIAKARLRQRVRALRDAGEGDGFESLFGSMPGDGPVEASASLTQQQLDLQQQWEAAVSSVVRKDRGRSDMPARRDASRQVGGEVDGFSPTRRHAKTALRMKGRPATGPGESHGETLTRRMAHQALHGSAYPGSFEYTAASHSFRDRDPARELGPGRMRGGTHVERKDAGDAGQCHAWSCESGAWQRTAGPTHASFGDAALGDPYLPRLEPGASVPTSRAKQEGLKHPHRGRVALESRQGLVWQDTMSPWTNGHTPLLRERHAVGTARAAAERVRQRKALLQQWDAVRKSGCVTDEVSRGALLKVHAQGRQLHASLLKRRRTKLQPQNGSTAFSFFGSTRPAASLGLPQETQQEARLPSSKSTAELGAARAPLTLTRFRQETQQLAPPATPVRNHYAKLRTKASMSGVEGSATSQQAITAMAPARHFNTFTKRDCCWARQVETRQDRFLQKVRRDVAKLRSRSAGSSQGLSLHGLHRSMTPGQAGGQRSTHAL